MSVIVTISKVLAEDWATDEQFATMSDNEIATLVLEDLIKFVDGADWTVERAVEATNATA
jgi:hypothetical protein